MWTWFITGSCVRSTCHRDPERSEGEGPGCECGPAPTPGSLATLGMTWLPPANLSFILLVKPNLQRREVINDRGRVHLALAGQRFQRIGPGTALSHCERSGQPRAGGAIAVNRTSVQRTAVAGGLAQRAMELE